MSIRIGLKDGKYGFVEVVDGISSTDPFIKITDSNSNCVALINSDAMAQIIDLWLDANEVVKENA